MGGGSDAVPSCCNAVGIAIHFLLKSNGISERREKMENIGGGRTFIIESVLPLRLTRSRWSIEFTSQDLAGAKDDLDRTVEVAI